jgi:hypothetical protein
VAVAHEKCSSFLVTSRKNNQKQLQGFSQNFIKAQKHVENVLARGGGRSRSRKHNRVSFVKQIGLQYQQSTPDVDYIDFLRLNESRFGENRERLDVMYDVQKLSSRSRLLHKLSLEFVN